MFIKKEIGSYNTFQKVKIDIDHLSPDQGETFIVCENEDYRFIKYIPKRSWEEKAILAQSKRKPKHVLMCSNMYYNACVFNNNLFLFNETADINTEYSFIKRLDFTSKTFQNYNFRREYSNEEMVFDVVCRVSTDHYLKADVINNELIINVHREKGTCGDNLDSPANQEMDYEIVFKYIDNEFVPFFRQETDELPFIEN